jgi:hypothetical protein
MAWLYSTPLTRHRFILMDTFDTARLGFIQHLWHDVAWLYLTPSTRHGAHGLVLFNTRRRKEKEEKKQAQHKVISTT